MVDPSNYQGIGQFGRAYRIMLENDSHAPGSVDRVLAERMIRLCAETAAYLYEQYTSTTVVYQPGSRPELEQHLEQAVAGADSDEERIAAIARFCAGVGRAAPAEMDATPFGGSEEQIIRRGSYMCTDLARVGCALCQIAGLPARVVMLFDTDQAYSGHVIIEAHRSGAWGAVDTTTDVVYRHQDGRPASTWELMNRPDLIEAHARGPSTPYARAGQFRAAAISNYPVWQWREYDYTESPVNEYYRSILEMSDRGWPGELRWLHGEDAACDSEQAEG